MNASNREFLILKGSKEIAQGLRSAGFSRPVFPAVARLSMAANVPNSPTEVSAPSFTATHGVAMGYRIWPRWGRVCDTEAEQQGKLAGVGLWRVNGLKFHLVT